MKEDQNRKKDKPGALPDDAMGAVSGGKGKTDAWVRQYCPNCGKPRTMNMDAYGNYVCLVCHKKYVVPKNME